MSDLMTFVAVQPSIESPVAQRPKEGCRLLRRAFEACGPGVYVLPEYYLAHLHPERRRTLQQAEPVPGPLTQPFQAFAHDTGCIIVVGLIESSDTPDKSYNTAAILGSDGVIARHRKTHLWDLGSDQEAYRECKLFAAGDRFDSFKVGDWRIGVMICAEGMFPEVPRMLTLKGADVILYPNGRDFVGLEAESAFAANAVPVVVSNPIGFNGADDCRGGSRIIASGSQSATCEQRKDTWSSVTLDLNQLRHNRAGHNALRLRRPELYAAIRRDTNSLTETI